MSLRASTSFNARNSQSRSRSARYFCAAFIFLPYAAQQLDVIHPKLECTDNDRYEHQHRKDEREKQPDHEKRFVHQCRLRFNVNATASAPAGRELSRKYSMYFCVGSSIFLMRSCICTSRGGA